MKTIVTILALSLSAMAYSQVDNRSELFKEESKEVDKIVKLMNDKCMSYQFSLSWVKQTYDEKDPRRQKFEDEVLRKFLKECKNKDLDKFEEESRLNYK